MLQNYNHRKLEDIPEKLFSDFKSKLHKIQSDDPLVTIALIAYNEEDRILATIASLAELKSNYPFEILIVNNNSTDNTQTFIDKCGLQSVIEEEQGYAHARQRGLDAARGKYILTGDCDTIYQPNWLNLMIKPLVKKQSITCTFSLPVLISDTKKCPLAMQLYQYAKLLWFHFRNISRPQLNCGGASMAYRKEEADRLNGYYLNVNRGEDGYLALHLGHFGKIKMVSSQKAAFYTSMRRTANDGSLARAFTIRFLKNMGGIFTMLTPQKLEIEN